MTAKKKAAAKKAVVKKVEKQRFGRHRSEEEWREIVDHAKKLDTGKKLGASLAAAKFRCTGQSVHNWAKKFGVELRKGANAGMATRYVKKRPIKAEEIKNELARLAELEELLEDKREEFDLAKRQLNELEKQHERLLNNLRKRI